MRRSLLAIGLLLALQLTADAAAPDAFAANRRLSRTLNLGNALEAPREGEWGVTLEGVDFPTIKRAGFTAVRVPIRWSAHAGAKSPFVIEPEFFRRIDWVIENALAQDLAVIVNVHHYEALDRDPAGQRLRFLTLWTQIAQRYQKHDERLYFELLNEPHDKLTAPVWNALLRDALQAIRPTNPERYVIVGPIDWNSLWELKTLELPADDRRLIVTFHYYNPFPFTHQGASWIDGAEKWLGTRWRDAPDERQAIRDDLEIAVRWAAAAKRPLFLGEFGAYEQADWPSRVRWTRRVRATAEELGISWAYWEFAAGFGVYDRAEKSWRDDLLDALIPADGK